MAKTMVAAGYFCKKKEFENYANEKHWKVSQAVREIIIKFFNYELSDNAG